jgi:hypothetical protein
MKKPAVDLGHGHATGGRTIDSQHHFISARRRRSARAKGRRDKAIGIAHAGKGDGKGNGVGRAGT